MACTLWVSIDLDDKKVFEDVAKRLQEEHKDKYPDYKYSSKKKQQTTIHYDPGYGSGASFHGAYTCANCRLSSMGTISHYPVFDPHPGYSVGSAVRRLSWSLSNYH